MLEMQTESGEPMLARACPFCASLDLEFDEFTGPSGFRFCKVRCNECDAAGPETPSPQDPRRDQREAAIERWNERGNPRPHAAALAPVIPLR